MSMWNGEHPALWEKAIERSASIEANRAERHKRIWANFHKPQHIAAVLSLSVIAVILVGVLLPAIGHSRFASRIAANKMDQLQVQMFEAPSTVGSPAMQRSMSSDSVSRVPSPAMNGSSYATMADGASSDVRRKEKAAPADESAARQVIHKATLEFSTPDVAATFAKAQHILRADLGEYIEKSSLTGEGLAAQGQLTLRIASSRLDDAMNQIRLIATVKAESVTGDDVTAQAVDLDARIRNEQKVETEMLQLLESRRGAPLADVLSLREKLSGVRESIERLKGQRDFLTRRVSLATVLVIIRPDGKPPESKEPVHGLLEQFGTSIGQSWNDGARTLADSLGWFVRVAIGGLAWWLLVGVAVFAAVRLWRRVDPAR